MKKRNLWAMSLIGLALTACTQDEEINNAINQGNEDGALVTLTIDVAKPQTKGSPGATNQQPGTDVENTISNVTVVVDYGGTNQKIYSSSGSFDTGYGWDSDNKEFKFKAPEGTAKFYVYANVNTADNLSSSWSTSKVSGATDVSAYYANNMFFMSNQNGEGIEHAINRDTENKVEVDIERAAAKVTVESASIFTDTDFGGTMTAMSFALGNMVDKFYLLQQSPISVPSGVTYNPTNDVATSWTIVDLGKTADEDQDGSQALTAFTGAYCMENIASTGKQNVTTYIKFQTTFTPGKAIKLESNTGAGEDAPAYKVAAALQNITAPGEDDPIPTFYVVLAGDDNITSNYIMKSELYQNNGTDLKEGIELTTNTSDITVSGIEGITKISLPYTEGKCYFGPIWFNQQGTTTLTSPIYRNDWYHLTVTSVKLPGSPQEPGDGGDIPLNPDADVTVKATVLNWELEERNIALE